MFQSYISVTRRPVWAYTLTEENVCIWLLLSVLLYGRLLLLIQLDSFGVKQPIPSEVKSNCLLIQKHRFLTGVCLGHAFQKLLFVTARKIAVMAPTKLTVVSLVYIN